MSNIITAVKCHYGRAILIGTSISVSIVVIPLLWKKFFSEYQGTKLPRLKKSILKLSTNCEIDISLFDALIANLENFLLELEPQRFKSEISRGKYELLASIVLRWRGICVDLQRFVSEDFQKKASTEEIARSVWSSRSTQNVRAATLSVFSDDSFATAFDDLEDDIKTIDEIPVNTSNLNLHFYLEGLKAVREGRVKYRKSRADICKCEFEQDFAAKVYCLRKALSVFISDEHKKNWLIQSGKIIVGDLLRHSGREATSFCNAYDRLIQFLDQKKNRTAILEELNPRKVEEINLWDVLFDFIMLDAFDDMRKPPSSIAALIRNSWLGFAMKEAAVNNIVWSLIKIKRSKLISDGFISRFYDISGIITTPLTFGLLGGGRVEFQELCLYFKDVFTNFVIDLFDIQKVRYTSLEELSEDVEKLMNERVELLKLKLKNELLPST